jgi:molecular chaperone IbpA
MIGVDRLADLIQNAARSDADSHFPPYDIEKTGDDSYRITVAAAGFSVDELDIIAQPNLLIIAGRKAKSDDEARVFLHRGIASRGFERRFELADYVVVKGADYDNGALTIELAREVPEALKPRRIEIGASDADPEVRRLRGERVTRRAA